jgi:hypothetical protein
MCDRKLRKARYDFLKAVFWNKVLVDSQRVAQVPGAVAYIVTFHTT